MSKRNIGSISCLATLKDMDNICCPVRGDEGALDGGYNFEILKHCVECEYSECSITKTCEKLLEMEI